MVILRSTYTGTDDEVGALRPAHLEWLGKAVADGRILCAGRLADGSGAAVVGPGTDADAFVDYLHAEDPYCVGGDTSVATYAEEITFAVGLGHEAIKALDA